MGFLYKAATRPKTAIPNPAPAILFALPAEAELVAEALVLAAVAELAEVLLPERVLEPVAAEAAELTADDTDDAAEEAEDPLRVVTAAALLPVLLP